MKYKIDPITKNRVFFQYSTGQDMPLIAKFLQILYDCIRKVQIMSFHDDIILHYNGMHIL
jgi:hypothetical protein